MHRTVRNAWLSLLVLLAGGAVCRGDAEKNAALGKAAQWERAALNREWAAYAQLEEAGEAQAAAAALRSAPQKNEQERRNAMRRAGDIELQVVRSYAAAMANFDKAVAGWTKAAQQYRQAGSEQGRRAAEGHAGQDSGEAASACRLAALAAERAAEDFGAEGAGMLSRAAAASQTAATWWEHLAARD